MTNATDRNIFDLLYLLLLYLYNNNNNVENLSHAHIIIYCILRCKFYDIKNVILCEKFVVIKAIKSEICTYM